LPVLQRLFRTKPLDELVAETEEPQHQLRRVLGPWNIVALGEGAIIGAGIFATIGIPRGPAPGPRSSSLSS
jgi:APA family basic amino acid/polyamine antiporter